MIDFFFFKQKTAYEMRISDWSSDVCSSDLGRHEIAGVTVEAFRQDHGNSGESLGLIFGGRFAYSTDVHALSDAQLDRLAALQLDTWIVDCLRAEPTTAPATLAL